MSGRKPKRARAKNNTSSFRSSSSSTSSEYKDDASVAATFGSPNDQPFVIPDSISVPASSSSSQSSERGLPFNIKKQLAPDIHSSGGLDKVVIKDLIASNKQAYGEPNTFRNTQTRNQITRWKGPQPDKYNDLVLGIQPPPRSGDNTPPCRGNPPTRRGNPPPPQETATQQQPQQVLSPSNNLSSPLTHQIPMSPLIRSFNPSPSIMSANNNFATQMMRKTHSKFFLLALQKYYLFRSNTISLFWQK